MIRTLEGIRASCGFSADLAVFAGAAGVEKAAILGGLRVLGANHHGSVLDVLTERSGRTASS